MRRSAHRLQNRLMWVLSSFVLITSALFAFYAMVFMYSVEDALFESALDHETTAQLEHHARFGNWDVPRGKSITLHTEITSFPDDLEAAYRIEPWRHEFSGHEGRHYHLRAIDSSTPASRVWLVAEVSKQLIVRPLRGKVFTLLAGSGAVLVIIALLAAYLVARRTTAPLSHLADAVGKMEPDHLSAGFSKNFREDEVGILARGIDALIARIQQFIAREQEFTRDASHELRTPLAVIRASVEGLLRETELSRAGIQQLQFLRESSMQLEQTVTSLLSLARDVRDDDTGAAISVLPVIERVIVEQAPLLEGKPVTIEIDVPPASRMRIAPAVLHILLANLIGNAFAHTAAGNVRIDRVGQRLRIVNTANGDEPALKWREPAAFIKREGSSGLGFGLGIVRRLCDRYEIDLRIESVDGETEVTIELESETA